MSQSERLKKIINSLLESPKSFAKGIGLPSATSIYDVLNDKRELTPALLKKIIATYPSLNPDWLMYGTGTMLIVDKPVTVEDKPEQYGVDCKKCADRDLIIEEQRKIIEQQRLLIDSLLADKN